LLRWQVTRFRPSVRMSTYLVAFAISDFTFIETVSANGTQNAAFRFLSCIFFSKSPSCHIGLSLRLCRVGCQAF
jgi:hypothetical protein